MYEGKIDVPRSGYQRGQVCTFFGKGSCEVEAAAGAQFGVFELSMFRSRKKSGDVSLG